MTAAGEGAVVVTGASRGIGAAVVRQLAARGVPVCINHRDSEDEAERLRREVVATGVAASMVCADMAREDDIVALFAAAERDLGSLRGLVNNAAYLGQAGRRVDEADAAVLHQSFIVNVVGPFLTCREMVRRISTKYGGQGGRIVNVSSIAARSGSPNDWVDYAASKSAVDTLTLGLAREVAAEGVRVNGVSPGIVATDLHARAGAPERIDRIGKVVPVQRAGTAEEMAEVVVWLLLDAPDYLHGTTIDVAGGA